LIITIVSRVDYLGLGESAGSQALRVGLRGVVEEERAGASRSTRKTISLNILS
jgi:hypothetical protein